MIIRRDEAFRTVCELKTPISNTKYRIGTGLFVCTPAGENAMYGWIVTASHVARETRDNTQIILSTKEGRAQVLELKLFGTLDSWRHHPIADISAFRIFFTDNNKEILVNRFIPLDHINTKREPVSRDCELTSIGFPHGLGTEGSFSPLTFRSYASSGFLTLNRADTKTPSEFFCLENPSVGGYSGCPVFDLGYTTNEVMTISKGKTICNGFMHGTMCDETGGKIAMVTPAFYLMDLIASP